MAFGGLSFAPRQAVQIDLRDLELAPKSEAWLAAQLGTLKPTLTQLDTLEFGERLDDEQARVLKQVRSALQHISHNVAASASSQGAPAHEVFALRTPRKLHGEPELVTDVRNGMPAALCGQERHLEAFCRLAKDFASEARLTPPVLVLAGDPGHGKDQAVAGLTPLLLGEKAKVHKVSLESVTDADTDRLFDGPLSRSTIAQGKVPQLVHITGLDGLATRAPKVSLKLQELLIAGFEAKDKRFPFVLDFNAPAKGTSIQSALKGAVASAGARVTSAVAVFDRLGDAAMRTYAISRLAEILEAPSMNGVKLDFDDAALETLGHALVTPHAPLDELDARLLRLVLTQIDTQRLDPTEPMSALVTPSTSLDENSRRAIVDNLHTDEPDLIAAESLLDVRVYARGDQANARHELESGLWELAESARTFDRNHDYGRVIEALDMALLGMLPHVAARFQRGELDLLSHSELEQLEDFARQLSVVPSDVGPAPSLTTRGLDLVQGIAAVIAETTKAV